MYKFRRPPDVSKKHRIWVFSMFKLFDIIGPNMGVAAPWAPVAVGVHDSLKSLIMDLVYLATANSKHVLQINQGTPLLNAQKTSSSNVMSN